MKIIGPLVCTVTTTTVTRTNHYSDGSTDETILVKKTEIVECADVRVGIDIEATPTFKKMDGLPHFYPGQPTRYEGFDSI